MRRLPFDYAVRNLGRSPMRVILSVASCATASLLVIAGVGFQRGLDRALGQSAVEGNIIILGEGSEESLERSEIAARVATLVSTDIEGIRTLPEGPEGVAFVSPEVHAALPIGQAGNDSRRSNPTLIFRGVTPAAHLVHPHVRIVDGRAPEPGTSEVLVGRQAQASLARAGISAAIGDEIPLGADRLPIVGVFSAPGTVFEGEAWIPLQSLRTLTQRVTDSCVVLTLSDAGDPAEVEAFTASRIELELSSLSETEYYAALSQFLAPVRWLVLATSAIVAFGAMLGGLGTLDVAFATRIRELGTLQALGFRRRAIALSFVQESLLIAAAGALLAAAAGLALVDGTAVRSSMGAFAIAVDATAILFGFLAALVLGVVGALVPALRCLRRPVPDSIRAAG